MNRRLGPVIGLTLVFAASILVAFYLFLTGLTGLLISLLIAFVPTLVIQLVSRLLGEHPSVRVRVLPDRKGFFEPPSDIKLGTDKHVVVTAAQPTDPDRPKAHPSQFLELYWLDTHKHPGKEIHTSGPGRIDVELNRLIYRFGVLEVSNSGGHIEDLHANGWYRVAGKSGWYPAGSINWHSPIVEMTIKRDVKLCQAILERPQYGLNEQLTNPSVSLSDGESTFLPLYYMRFGRPEVFFNGAPAPLNIGNATDEQPLQFESRVEIAGKGLSVQRHLLKSTVSWAEFTTAERRELWWRRVLVE